MCDIKHKMFAVHLAARQLQKEKWMAKKKKWIAYSMVAAPTFLSAISLYDVVRDTRAHIHKRWWKCQWFVPYLVSLKLFSCGAHVVELSRCRFVATAVDYVFVCVCLEVALLGMKEINVTFYYLSTQKHVRSRLRENDGTNGVPAKRINKIEEKKTETPIHTVLDDLKSEKKNVTVENNFLSQPSRASRARRAKTPIHISNVFSSLRRQNKKS